MDHQRMASAGKLDEQDQTRARESLKDVQRVLRPVRVINPFAEYLELPRSVFKPRRTNSHYLQFIEAVTFYKQCQREQQANEETGEVINGVRAIIFYDPAVQTFEGTFENLNSNTAQQTRLGVHIIDANGSTNEFGLTTPVDMQSGEMRNVSLVIAGGTGLIEFTMYPEVGPSGTGG